MNLKNLNDILKHPSTSLILGDTGEGKTAAGAAALEWFHGENVYVYMMDKQKGYPKWVNNLSPDKIEMKEPNSVLFIDDAHNYFYAGKEEDLDDLKAIDLINRARRHGGRRSIIYNTQMSNALSRKLIGMTTFLIFKKSSPVQIQFERPEFQKMFIKANEALREQPINIGYVLSSGYEGLIDIDMPGWYTPELSEMREVSQGRSGKEGGGGIFKTVTSSISGIGKMFG